MVQLNTIKRRASAVSGALRNATNRIENETVLLPNKGNKLIAKCVNSRESLEKVFRLAYDVYSEKGYAFQHETKMETSVFDANDKTLILMVENDKNEIIGSMSLYYDDGKLLPADSIFNEELNSLRNQGIKFAEVSRFVVRQDYQHQKDILISLINTIFIHAFRIMKIDEFVIEVNPRHVDYYKKLLGFVQFGNVKECPRVNNAPAVLLRCNNEKYLKIVDKGEFERRTLYNNFLPKNLEAGVIEMLRNKRPLSLSDKEYFNIF